MTTHRPPTLSLLRLFLLILLISYPKTILCSSSQPPSPLASSSSSSSSPSSSSSSSIPQPQQQTDTNPDDDDPQYNNNNNKQQQQQQQQQLHQHPPRCIAADSYHTYICTENAEATRRAIEQFASNGDDDSATITTDSSSSTTTSSSSLDKNTLPTTLYSHHNNIDLGVEQRITGSDTEQTNIRTMIKKMHIYMEEEVYSRSEYEIVRMNGKCKNHHELCAFWSSVGECETNRGFMMENCVAACRLCLLASVNMMMA